MRRMSSRDHVFARRSETDGQVFIIRTASFYQTRQDLLSEDGWVIEPYLNLFSNKHFCINFLFQLVVLASGVITSLTSVVIRRAHDRCQHQSERKKDSGGNVQ